MHRIIYDTHCLIMHGTSGSDL